MKIIKWILIFKEYLVEIKKVMKQGYYEEDWMEQPCITDWFTVLVMELIFPTGFILFFGYKFDFWLNIPLTYLIFGIGFCAIALGQEIRWVHNHRKRQLYTKEGIENLRRLIEELEVAEIAQEEEESGKAEQKEPESKSPEKNQ